MQPTTKTFAQFTDYSWRTSAPVEITSEAEALQHATARRAILFTTFDQTSVTINGKEMTGEPENRSARRYVGIDKVYTRDEVIQSMEDEKKTLSRDWAAAVNGVIREYKKMPADSLHITGLERQGEFITLKAGEKVFDRTGKQLYPAAGNAAPKVTPKP